MRQEMYTFAMLNRGAISLLNRGHPLTTYNREARGGEFRKNELKIKADENIFKS